MTKILSALGALLITLSLSAQSYNQILTDTFRTQGWAYGYKGSNLKSNNKLTYTDPLGNIRASTVDLTQVTLNANNIASEISTRITQVGNLQGQVNGKLDTSATYITNIVLQNSGLFHTSPATFNYANHTATLVQTLANQNQYTLFGRAVGVGQPSALTFIDSNWIPTLHSKGFYDLSYIQNQTAVAQNAGFNISGKMIGNYLLVQGTVNASGGGANGAVIAPSLNALQNNDQLTAVNINPAYYANGHTGVIPTGLHVNGRTILEASVTNAEIPAYAVLSSSGNYVDYTINGNITTLNNHYGTAGRLTISAGTVSNSYDKVGVLGYLGFTNAVDTQNITNVNSGLKGEVHLSNNSNIKKASGISTQLSSCIGCTIGTYYDLYLRTPATAGTIQDHYAIYQADVSAKNYFAALNDNTGIAKNVTVTNGILGVGGTGTGGGSQTLSISGNLLSISGGNTVTLPSGGATTNAYVSLSQPNDTTIVFTRYDATKDTVQFSFPTYSFNTTDFSNVSNAISLKPIAESKVTGLTTDLSTLTTNVSANTTSIAGKQSILTTSNAWTREGAAATVTYNMDSIHIGCSTTDFTNRLLYEKLGYTTNEWLDYSITFKLNSGNGGIGIGERNKAVTNRWYGWLSLSTKTLGIYYNNSLASTEAANTSSALNFSNGDKITLRMVRTNRRIDFYALDETNGASVSIGYNLKNVDGGTFMTVQPFISKPEIEIGACDVDVVHTSIFFNTPKDAEAIVIGDSKTAGGAVGDYSNRYVDQLVTATGKNLQVLASAGDATGDVLNRLKEIDFFNTKKAVLFIGCNDVRNGVATATWQANYQAIVSYLTQRGITVYHLTPAPEKSGVNFTTLRSWIQTTYGANVVDIYPLINTSTDITSDNVHLTASGNTVIKNALLPLFNTSPTRLLSRTSGQTATQDVVIGTNLTLTGDTLNAIAGSGGGVTYTTTDNNLTISGSSISTKEAPQVFTDGATITIDASLGYNWNGTIAGNRTFAFSNTQAGQYIKINITQDATGSRTVTWPANVKWKGGAAPTLTTTANATDIVILYFNGTNYYGVYGNDFK